MDNKLFCHLLSKPLNTAQDHEKAFAKFRKRKLLKLAGDLTCSPGILCTENELECWSQIVNIMQRNENPEMTQHFAWCAVGNNKRSHFLLKLVLFPSISKSDIAAF